MKSEHSLARIVCCVCIWWNRRREKLCRFGFVGSFTGVIVVCFVTDFLPFFVRRCFCSPLYRRLFSFVAQKYTCDLQVHFTGMTFLSTFFLAFTFGDSVGGFPFVAASSRRSSLNTFQFRDFRVDLLRKTLFYASRTLVQFHRFVLMDMPLSFAQTVPN